MLGSLDEAEDLVQETFLRAWRKREGFGADGRREFRAWLYRIATNACLDQIRRRPRRVTPPEVAGPSDPEPMPAPPVDLPWLQPYPDRLLEQASPAEEQPAESVVARETIELAFIAAIQHLPARQRAVLILRDVAGWSAREAADLLESSVAAVNSALQRARATLRDHLGERRSEWSRIAEASALERELLDRYLEVHEQGDAKAFAELLREDARMTMPPHPSWYEGREAIVIAAAKGFDPAFGRLHGVATAANGQPAAAWYVLEPGASEFRAIAIDVLDVADGVITAINTFAWPELFEAFGLPERLPADDR
jgi:RNA polymerase sigma-70 factor (ECF subfamily)